MKIPREITVEEVSRDVYMEFAAGFADHIKSHPVCEVCGKEPSVRITRWGPIKAACWTCLGEEMKRFEDYCREEEAIQKQLDSGFW